MQNRNSQRQRPKKYDHEHDIREIQQGAFNATCAACWIEPAVVFNCHSAWYGARYNIKHMIYHTLHKTYLPNMHEEPHTDRTIVMHLAILRVTALALPVAEVALVAAVAAAWSREMTSR